MKILALMSLSLLSFNAFSWGPTGHRVVGEIAQKHLKWKTKKKIKKILDGESLARVSNWPDKIKSDPDKYAHTFSWHYTTWADTSKPFAPQAGEGSLVSAIEDQLKVLKTRKTTKAEKAFALKFLVHLVGDLHMPLHVGNGTDRGANDCKVTFHREKVNLHRLWDEKLIEFTRLSFTEMTRFIDIKSKKEEKEMSGGSVVDWARESALLRPSAYPEEVATDKKGVEGKPNYCQRDLALTNEELPRLGYQYSYKFMPIVEKRLYQAGLRLARLLDDAL